MRLAPYITACHRLAEGRRDIVMGFASILEQNLSRVRQRIAEAAYRSGRRPQDIRLVAVTKYVPPPVIRELVQLGQHEIGESRPQQLWERSEELRDLPVTWHLVGPLQRNKVRKTLPKVTWIHSIDTVPLLDAVNRIAGELGVRLKLLLEVNISRHPAKRGFDPEIMQTIVQHALGCENGEVCGLMAMAGVEGDLTGARRDFRSLRELRDRLQAAVPQAGLKELSMGMSGDFEIGIEEGATMVRIGSALFEGLILEE